ncbi:fish-egg lectin-like [Rana temporaria]|uniref:fish-egg lectin-like n=1 Tax=Rana temporaria TaxID=8407 RepID=UPI001AAD052B|nr:fish-egg lectin-like [Rana temporaria]
MLFAVSLLLLCTGISAAPGFQCKTIPGKLKQIDAGAGAVLGVNSNDDIYYWVDNDWNYLPGKLTHVTVGPAGIWGVNKDNAVFKIQDIDWVPVSGSLKQVDAGGYRFLVGVDSQDNIFCLGQSDTLSKSPTVSWTPLEGSLKYYSCGILGCWGVNTADDIFFRYNVIPTSCQGNKWQQIEGSLAMIEVGTDGSVYGVNSAGNVYKRDGISPRIPTGTSWTQLDLHATFKHVTYDKGYLWLITPTDDIMQCSFKM